MNQKKHLNAEAALEASKDAEPGSKWNGDFCKTITCDKCYADTGNVRSACFYRSVRAIRSDFESGLDAYHKRKEEKALERAAEDAAPLYAKDGPLDIEGENFGDHAPPIIDDCTPGCGDGQDIRGPILGGPRTPPLKAAAPLIPEPPDTPEVRKVMEHLARPEGGEDGCNMPGRFCDDCPFHNKCEYENRQARHDFAVGWLERHRKPDAGDFPMFIMRDGLSHPEFWNFPPTTMQWRPATHADVDPLLLENKRAARIKELEEALGALCPDGDIGEGLSSGYTLSSKSILDALAALDGAEEGPCHHGRGFCPGVARCVGAFEDCITRDNSALDGAGKVGG